MDWAAFFNRLQEERMVIAQAPWHFAGAVVLVGVLIWFITNRIYKFLYKDRLDKALGLVTLYEKGAPITPRALVSTPGGPVGSAALRRPHIQVLSFDPQPIAPAEIVAGTVLLRNDGNTAAHAAIFSYVYLQPTPSSEMQERVADTLFTNFVTNQIRNENPTHVIPPENLLQRIVAGPLLSANDARALSESRTTIYFVGRVSYRDASGTPVYHTDFCRYVNQAGSFASGVHNEAP